MLAAETTGQGKWSGLFGSKRVSVQSCQAGKGLALKIGKQAACQVLFNHIDDGTEEGQKNSARKLLETIGQEVCQGITAVDDVKKRRQQLLYEFGIGPKNKAGEKQETSKHERTNRTASASSQMNAHPQVKPKGEPKEELKEGLKDEEELKEGLKEDLKEESEDIPQEDSGEEEDRTPKRQRSSSTQDPIQSDSDASMIAVSFI